MSAKQDRQGARTATDLERKYNFGKTFAELMGVDLENRERVESVYSELSGVIETKTSAIMRDNERISMEVNKQTEKLDEYQKSVDSKLELTAEQFGMRFSSMEKSLEEVNGELQKQINEITKYFTFDINGLTIGQVDNPNKVVIDNDEITIMVGGKVRQKFDADGNALIPMLTITESLKLLGLYVEETDTHINFTYTGG